MVEHGVPPVRVDPGEFDPGEFDPGIWIDPSLNRFSVLSWSVAVKAGDYDRRVTLKDVARAVGVAPSTVSNAYNRPDQLSESLRARILATAERMGYAGPDPRARDLRRGTSTTIGLVYPSRLSYAFTDPMAALFIQGLAEEVERYGYGLLLVGGPADDPAVGAPQGTPVQRAPVDGFVLHAFADDDPLFTAALARRLPTVVVDNPAATDLPCVAIDDAAAAAGAAAHLLALGHRSIGVLSLELTLEPVGGLIGARRQAQARYRATRERLTGYRRALTDAGLAWDAHAVVFESIDNTVAEGRRGARLLWEAAPRPTALLAMSDQLAFGALAFARERGLSVPGDLSVIGFDDVPSSARSSPALTTVHQPTVRKGREAGRLLLRALHGESAPARVWLPTELALRASTGPPGPPAGGDG
jgi:DNA-binding LacI/PurR family transcriptional regulator